MGVLECNRAGCTEIMCGRLSHTYGYICWECFDELVSKGVKTNVGEFMKTPKEPLIDEEIVRSYFDAIFPTTKTLE